MATRVKGGSSPRQRIASNISDSGKTNGLSSPQTNGLDLPERRRMSEMERKEREQLVLWRHPLTTLKYSLFEFLFLAKNFAWRLWKAKKIVALCTLVLTLAVFIYYFDGPHQSMISEFQRKALWCLYWVGLGILSSVGLGTGLHTFILYLGPHIAMVTMAAYECKSVDFPEPPYPTEVVCPESEGGDVNVWTIMSKVRLEAVMWGAGTAIGELPPYFMARAARLSGADMEDDEFEEIEELIHEKQEHPHDLGLMERAKLWVHNLVQRVGFFGILACASIPNPLFDLAGITCGHFLIPFWTFFGATLIGKAIIKMHIQKMFVIFLFSVHHVETVISLMGKVPYIGKSLQEPFRDWLAKQKQKLHHKPGSAGAGPSEGSWLAAVFEKVVMVMVVYFILSIVNSTAQSYHKRLCKAKRTLVKAGVHDYTRIIPKSSKD